MAFLAGQGMSAGEVAEAMGNGLSGGKVGAQLRRYGIKSTRRADEEIMQLRWLRRDRQALEAVASERRYDALEIAVIALRVLLAEPALFGQLLDQIEELERAEGCSIGAMKA